MLRLFRMEPKAGEKYKHFKGEDMIYEIVAVSKDCDFPENKVVVYKSLYETGEFPSGTIWHRSLDDFIGFKELDGKKVKRFTRIE